MPHKWKPPQPRRRRAPVVPLPPISESDAPPVDLPREWPQLLLALLLMAVLLFLAMVARVGPMG